MFRLSTSNTGSLERKVTFPTSRHLVYLTRRQRHIINNRTHNDYKLVQF